MLSNNCDCISLNFLKVAHAEREILEIDQDIRVSLLNWIIHGLVRTDCSLMFRDLAMLLGLARVVGLRKTLGETGKRKESGEEKVTSDIDYFGSKVFLFSSSHNEAMIH